MAYKDILVYAGGTGFEARVRLAAGLAEAYGAHVVGLHVAAPPDLPPYVEAQLTRELLQAHERLVSQERDACQAGFDAAFKGASVSAEWRASEGDEADILQLHGRYADLVVLGQEDPETPGADVAGQIVLMLGRPVLVVPYVGTFETVGQRVLVAWDASRAAARAHGAPRRDRRGPAPDGERYGDGGDAVVARRGFRGRHDRHGGVRPCAVA